MFSRMSVIVVLAALQAPPVPAASELPHAPVTRLVAFHPRPQLIEGPGATLQPATFVPPVSSEPRIEFSFRPGDAQADPHLIARVHLDIRPEQIVSTTLRVDGVIADRAMLDSHGDGLLRAMPPSFVARACVDVVSERFLLARSCQELPGASLQAPFERPEIERR